MPLGDHFDSLMSQPGPSAAPQEPSSPGGLMSNSAIEQANMTNPLQRARIATATSLQAIKRLAAEAAEAHVNG